MLAKCTKQKKLKYCLLQNKNVSNANKFFTFIDMLYIDMIRLHLKIRAKATIRVSIHARKCPAPTTSIYYYNHLMKPLFMFFSKLSITSIIAKRYCQSIDLDNILLLFSIVTSLNLVIIRQHFFVIQLLSRQPDLMLV